MPKESKKRSYTSEEVTKIEIASLECLIEDIENQQVVQEEDNIASIEHFIENICESDSNEGNDSVEMNAESDIPDSGDMFLESF